MKQELIKIFLNSLKPDKLLSIIFNEGKYSIAAWEEFLCRYSKLFLKIIWKYQKDHDLVMESYVKVCEKLYQDKFRVLKKYNSEFSGARPKLSTWLTVVVNNICLDIYRKEHGRKRFPKALKILSEKEREFFVLYYWKGFSLDEISHQMNLNSRPGNETASDILSRIESVLTRSPEKYSAIINIPFEEENYIPKNNNTDPELEEMINRLLEELPVKDKVVIQLRFSENLTAKDISRIMNIKPYQKVYSIINKSLKLLRHKAEWV